MKKIVVVALITLLAFSTLSLYKAETAAQQVTPVISNPEVLPSVGIAGRDTFMIKANYSDYIGQFYPDWRASAVGSVEEPSQMVVNDPHTFFEAVGGTGFDYASSMTQPVEGKPFAVTGFWDYYGVFDAFIGEFNSSGGLNWARGLGDGKTGGRHCDTGTSVVETSDGEFVITGETYLGTGGDGDLLLAKFKSNGDLDWAYAYGGAGWDRGCSVIQASNGDLVVTGVTTSFGAGGWDVLLAKFDSNGVLLWARALGRSGNEVGLSVIEDGNGDLVVTGWTTSFGNNMDVLLAKFHSDGGFAWAEAFGGSGADVGNSVVGGKIGNCDFGTDIYVTGYTSSFGVGCADLFVAKFDSGGNLAWIRTIGGTSDDIGCSLTLTFPVTLLASPMQIVVTGLTKSFGPGDEDVLVAAFDSAGNFKWARSFGGPSNDGCFSVKQALITLPFPFGDVPGVRLFLAGYTYSWGEYPEDILLASLDPYGDTYPPVNVIQPLGTCPALPPPNSFSPTDSTNISTLLLPQITLSNPAYPLNLNTNIFVTTVRKPPLVEYTDVGDTTKPVAFSFAIITDNHLHLPLLTQDVDWIKSNMAAEDIKFVMDLGDLTDQTNATGGRYNCIPANLLSVKAELDTLQPTVFYVPIIGNHDVWYYDNPSGGTSTDPNQPWFTKRPEEIFNQVFLPQYNYLSTILSSSWTKEPTPVPGKPPDAPGSVDNYFQNFAFDYMGYHFICLDWVSRDDVYTGSADGSGTGWPDLQQWASGGTLDWFTSHLASYVANNPSSAENVLIFAHHPLSYGVSGLSDGLLGMPLAFHTTNYTTLVNYLKTYKTNVDMWFSGHLHIPLEEDITSDTTNNQGSIILQTVGTAGVSPWAPSPINQNPYAPALRIVRVHSASKGVGGIVVSINKFELLAPYIGLASTIMIATVATAICVKRVRRRKEKQ
jgi:hypothetical protein